LHAKVEKILSIYAGLPPEAQTLTRRQLLQLAGEAQAAASADEAAQRSAQVPAKAPPTAEQPFETPSDQLFDYLADVGSALAAYLPTDSYQPGDEARLDLLREETLRAIEPVEWLLKTYFRYEVIGLEHVPRTGRAIVVSNHGLLPVDGWFLSYEIKRHTGRWPRGLTDWRIFQLPYLRQFFMDMGTVVGRHATGDALMQREELLFIMPGGSKEAWKSSKYRYRLLWQRRLGFIRLALRNGAPIVPSANVGTDDTYRVFLDGYTTAYKLFRSKKALLPISVPIGLGVLPFPVKMTQYVGEPIHFPYPPEAEHDPDVVKLCQEEVKSRVYELIDRGLREREERSVSHLR